MKNENYDFTDVIGYISILVIVVSLAFIGFKITGYATTQQTNATVNVTVNQYGAINFTSASINFGEGAVSNGFPGANLTTENSVTGGTWTPVINPLVLENIGNVNVSLSLQSDKNADTYIGPDATFRVKVSDTSGHTGACIIANSFNDYKEINTTSQQVCSIFQFGSLSSVDIDVHLYIPSSANPGAKSAIITAIGTYDS